MLWWFKVTYTVYHHLKGIIFDGSLEIDVLTQTKSTGRTTVSRKTEKKKKKPEIKAKHNTIFWQNSVKIHKKSSKLQKFLKFTEKC